MNLYEIDKSIQEAFEAAVDPETGEILDEEMVEKFEGLSIDREAKIENICLFIKNLKADAEALKAEKDAFAKRQKAAERKAESLSNYLKGYLDRKKWKAEDGRAVVSWRKSESVSVTDISQIPLTYLTMADPAPNKTEIKAALKRGEEVPGAELVTNQNMIIK